MARLTPMQRHQLRTQAAQASTTQAATGQQRALQWLHTQRALLSALQSRQAREAHKAQVLPEIEPYLHGVLEADTGAVDPVVQYAAVWSLDAGEWQLAIDLGQYAIRHGIPMPDEFQRNAPTLLLDLLADAALTGAMARDEINLHLPVAIAITEGQNMPAQTRAKATRPSPTASPAKPPSPARPAAGKASQPTPSGSPSSTSPPPNSSTPTAASRKTSPPCRG